MKWVEECSEIYKMKASSNLSKSVEEIILKEDKLIELTQKVVDGQKALEAKEAQFNIAVLNELELKEANELKILELEKALEDSRKNEAQLSNIIHQKDEQIDKLSPHKLRNNPHRFGR